MEKALASRIGAAARTARKALGLTQDDAAERVGISPEFYARIERGGTMPSVPTLVRMCEALAVSADVLLGRSPSSPSLGEAGQAGVGVVEEPPELRRLLRRLRKARPRTLRLLGMLATELERAQR
ncbi:helix-turn-helix domain-containing protein [Anaeromyxobacter oryzisoli]|uniref:helix-turn-helix domain-containing protein n=1 Tax=Anaeromyxobacter oryzisoli TaxID=2925408 RepID=UPI001F58586F|nr:helix-turn-helix transcriptional regulator [Anaeromyxobacter sp. SG63]